ncbi:MAG TPA: hypothetical protein VIR60_09455 [Gammaproteobacteria bacterium]
MDRHLSRFLPTSSITSYQRHTAQLGSDDKVKDGNEAMTDNHHIATPTRVTHEDPELQLFERQLRRFGEDGDCAYERALSTLYRKLFDQRQRQLDALRNAGL